MKKILLLILIVCSFDLFAISLDKKIEVLFSSQMTSIEKTISIYLLQMDQVSLKRYQ